MKTVILCLCLLCASYAIANEANNEEHCLKFYQGLEKNKVMDYLKYLNKITDADIADIKEFANYDKKAMSKLPWFSSIVYSASYDLNGDGNDEYFYFNTDSILCETWRLCRIELYEYKGGKFRDIGLVYRFLPEHTNPTDERNQHFICVLSTKDSPWRRLRINWDVYDGISTDMFYTNGHYK